MNNVNLLGNLVRSPEHKVLQSGMDVCSFTLAKNRRYKAQDGSPQEEVTYVDCSVFGKQAATLCRYVAKGDPLLVEGRLRQEHWETKDGQKRSKLMVVVERFHFVHGRRDGVGADGPSTGGADDGEDVPF